MTFCGRLARKLVTAANSCAGSNWICARFVLAADHFLRFAAAMASNACLSASGPVGRLGTLDSVRRRARGVRARAGAATKKI